MFHSNTHVLKCDYGLLNGFVSMGAIAMTGFFLLSGYALNLSTARKDISNVKEIKFFYLKRMISILPLYYAYAIVNVLINITTKWPTKNFEEIILFPIETLGIQSVYSTLFPFSHNGGSWFISCILICYFVFPLLNILTRELSDKNRIITIIVLSMILLYSPLVQHAFHLQTIYSNPFFRILEFSIGMLVCQLNINMSYNNKLIHYLRNRLACICSILTLIGGVSIAHHLGIPHDYMLYSWVALPCFISLLISLGYIRFERLKKTKIIHYLSALSFSIFLSQIIIVWHIVKKTMDYVNCDINIIKILMSAAVCFIIANVFHYCIEKPSSKYLKAKFLKL